MDEDRDIYPTDDPCVAKFVALRVTMWIGTSNDMNTLVIPLRHDLQKPSILRVPFLKIRPQIGY